MAKLADHIGRIAEGVTEGYKKIEDGVVDAYKKAENAFVDSLTQARSTAEDVRPVRHHSGGV